MDSLLLGSKLLGTLQIGIVPVYGASVLGWIIVALVITLSVLLWIFCKPPTASEHALNKLTDRKTNRKAGVNNLPEEDTSNWNLLAAPYTVQHVRDELDLD